MCAKKKASSNKMWKLAGEPIYSPPLTSAERDEIEEEFLIYKRLRGRDGRGMPTVTRRRPAYMRARSRPWRASSASITPDGSSGPPSSR